METTPTPQTASPVTTPPASTPANCVNGNCKDCIKGGIPMRREWLSVFMILFMVSTVVLFVLFVQAKRDGLADSTSSGKSAAMLAASPTPYPAAKARSYENTLPLPAPKTTGDFAIEKAIATRRSRRTFLTQDVSQAELSQMLWAGQGITDAATGKRTAPSAREAYPMTIFVIVKHVTGILPGLYEYIPKTHSLGLIAQKDMDPQLKEAAVQEGAQQSPVVFLVSANIGGYQALTKSTTTSATYMETGHIGQNMYLQTESLSMGMVVMAGFDSAKVSKALGLDPAEVIEYVIPFGHPAPEPTSTPVAVQK